MTRFLLLSLFLAAGASTATAQGIAFGGMRADSSAPVEVSADRLDVRQSDGSATFVGNVVIGQGEMRLGANSVTVRYGSSDQSRIQSLEASGNVTLVSGADEASAERASYDIDSGRVVMTGNVMLTQGQNVLTGDRMSVDLDTGTAQVDGRVRSILQPGSN